MITMGKAQRDKGARFERAVVNLAAAYHLDARRTAPNQTQDGDAEFADVRVAGRRVECKHRQCIGAYLWQWLGDHDALVIKRDGAPALAVIPLADWLEMIGGKLEAE
jgi:hypothetical protein